MKLNEVLQRLDAHGIPVQEQKTDGNGNLTIVVGCRLPEVDLGGRFVYSTLVLSPGQDEVSLEEREALKRHLGHLTTNIFGDDPDFEEELNGDDPSGSHLHSIVPRK